MRNSALAVMAALILAGCDAGHLDLLSGVQRCANTCDRQGARMRSWTDDGWGSTCVYGDARDGGR